MAGRKSKYSSNENIINKKIWSVALYIPIIDKETFEKAQELSKRDTKISQKTKELSVWAGFLR